MTSSGVKSRPADFSQSALEAFRKRSKALARRGAALECLPVKEIVDGRESERARIDVGLSFRDGGSSVSFRIHVWSDRWVWVDARRSSKSGWTWEFTREGRFSGIDGARGLVELAEKSMDASFLSNEDVSPALSRLWTKHLATGPKRAPF